MKDEMLKTQIFRFIDVLPTLSSSEQIARHLQEYFSEHPSVALQWGLRFVSPHSPIAWAVAETVRRNAKRMARRFIAGSSKEEILPILRNMREQKVGFTVDVLGEAVVSEEEAETYQKAYLDLLDWLSEETSKWSYQPQLDDSPLGLLPIVNLSIKLSSLCCNFEPADMEGTTEAVLKRFRPILRKAKDLNAFIFVDMEQYEYKDITFHIFRKVLSEPEFRDYRNFGIALQSYLKDAERDADELLDWVEERGTPITVRLVRGAYWDYERVIAIQNGWQVPVFEKKWETDACFERLALRLLQAYPKIELALGTHNARSMALIIVLLEALGLPKRCVEFQLLYGMGDGFKVALSEMGQRVRIYTPFGEAIPGMAYLVRRLLENTSQHSFLRLGFAERREPEEILKSPKEAEEEEKLMDVKPEVKKRELFHNEPLTDFARPPNQNLMYQALEFVRENLGKFYPPLIGDEEVHEGERLISVYPADPDIVVGETIWCDMSHAERAVELALKALPEWRKTSPQKRAEVLFRAADLMRKRRFELACWEVFEVGKNWREADADVAEAIDYLEYYGKEMLRLSEGYRFDVAGEMNIYSYEGRGVAVVISPFNFPLAIPCGMASAALVTGNTVILKPAEQAPIMSAFLVSILREAGAPAGAIHFLPGLGEEIGAFLVKHPKVNIIAFTGSKEVGTLIYHQASEVLKGQQHIKRVIAEMGGKNAIIVDNDADLDDAVKGVIVSAFSYAGQKCSACSRVIVLDGIYELFLRRLVASTRSLVIGQPEHPGSFLMPLIDEAALRKVQQYVKIGRNEGRCVLDPETIPLPDKGFYAAPAIFAEVDPKARIAQDEIFGPVLAVIKAKDFEEALEIANSVEYALTGGVYTRSPSHIEQAFREFRVGNLYINRKITGALVARQPFGGLKLSGIGSKAGGPDYLLQFMEPRTITENTLRRGFAPDIFSN